MKATLSRQAFVFLCGLFLSGCATTGGVRSELEAQTPNPNNTRICSGSPSEVKTVALNVLDDYDIKVNQVEESEGGVIIMGKKGMSGFSSGEIIGLSIKKTDSATSSAVSVLSKKVVSTQVFAKDWTSDILDGISAKARFEKDYSNNEKYDIRAQQDDWLASINKAVTTALAFESRPALGVKCEGRFGDYIADKIVAYVGSHNDKVELTAGGNNLNAIVEQQGLQMTGLFDEKTAAETGKMVGAKYLLVCSPYFKTEAGLVELHCKLINIETAKFLGGGLIVYFPHKELPSS